MFIERPISKAKSHATRSLVYGAGINDAPYMIRYTGTDGKEYVCPYFDRWKNMLQRVYYPRFKVKQPTYMDCTIEPAWLSFMAFRAWMETQDWQGKALDKDLLVQGNKHYGPATCIFVSQELNSLLCLKTNARGALPLGVSITKNGNKEYIRAQCSFYGKQTHIGYFDTVEEAAEAYKKAKLAYIKELAAKETNPKVREALLRLY